MDIEVFKFLYKLLDVHFPGIAVHAYTEVRMYRDVGPHIEYRLWIGPPLMDLHNNWWKSFEADAISNLQIQVQNYCLETTSQDPWND